MNHQCEGHVEFEKLNRNKAIKRNIRMERVFNFSIEHAVPKQKISGFLKTQGFSAPVLVHLKKDPESVWVNGKSVFQNHELQDGDQLEIRVNEKEGSAQILPVELPIDIVYEDEDLMVINKAAGMPIHPSLHNYDNTLGNALAWYFKQQEKPFVYRCINRLDRDTSGLTIVAKNMVSGAILSQMVAAKSMDGLEAEGIHREYLAIVKGDVVPPQGVITAPIARKESSCLERMVDFEQGERAITHYRVMEKANGHSLIALELETGRTHQIRVHMQYLGFPLIGDYLYNPDMEHIGRQALHAHKLSFPHPITKEKLEFCVPMPEDMRKVMEE